MFVDIIIPVYNPGAYLTETLDSCISQSYKNYKITVIDDCSTQDIKAMLKRYPSVNYLRTDTNLGPGGARNFGIRNTTGELISFIDSDDVMDREKLANSVEEFKKNKNIGMTCGNYRILVHGRLRSPFYKRAPTINHKALMRNNYVASGSVTVKRGVLEDVGMFDEEYWIAEDYDMWVRISEKYDIKYIHKILYFYRIIPGGNSLTQRGDVQKKHLSNLEEIKKASLERIKERDAIKGKKSDSLN